MVIQPALGGSGHASPEPLVFHIDEDGMRGVRRATDDAGLIRGRDDGDPHLPDRAGTVIELEVGQLTVGVAALLDPSGGHALTHSERTARQALRRFVRHVADPGFDRDHLVGR